MDFFLIFGKFRVFDNFDDDGDDDGDDDNDDGDDDFLNFPDACDISK